MASRSAAARDAPEAITGLHLVLDQIDVIDVSLVQPWTSGSLTSFVIYDKRAPDGDLARAVAGVQVAGSSEECMAQAGFRRVNGIPAARNAERHR